ncbi:MAG: prolyl oligopeptidase family serine peptidase, partial [Longimicrobiales bacterium]
EQPQKQDEDKQDGTDLVLRNLASGEELTFPHVLSYTFAKDGRHLAYATSTKDEGDDGLFVVNLERGTSHALLEGEGDYHSIAFDESSTQLVFLSNQADYESEQPHWTLYYSGEGESATAVATTGSPGVPAGWGVSEHRAPSFSDSGRRILFGTAPLPEPEPEEIEKDDEVVVDIWSWTDDLIQPMQLKQLEQERKRSYLALVHLGPLAPRVVQLGSMDMPEVSLGLQGDSEWALGTSDLRYRRQMQWDTSVPRDVWTIDATSGARTLRLEARRGRFQLSTGGRWVTWWDGEERQYFGFPTDGSREVACLTADIPHPLWNELHDSPSAPRAYGTGGWLAGDVGLLVYDRHDLWLVDPAGKVAPHAVTEGSGRERGLRFRRVDMDPDEPFVSPMEELLLSAFHLENKRSGFWTDRLLGGGEPVELTMADKRFSNPVPAKEGEFLRFTRQDFQEYPDLWVAERDLSAARKMSAANPQQAEFRWGTSELVSWRSTDGTPLQGILYKPEDFDPGRQYPLLVYFYERSSDGLHRHNDPVPSRSTIRFSYYTSNDYCIFVPDIPYRIGYPGASCANAVLPGILSLVDAGFVDQHAIGVQGHSWGGYQIAYLVTQTNLFAAGVAGAPVANMTSAYGGIRWGTGMSRQFQYEKSQSRLGGSLWEVPNRYFENSPLFFADKVETPLLMLHNDEDGAVPWYQGIEYFVALRRLSKPVWLLNYNGEDHGIGKYQNRRDYSELMSQFFDHYLRGAPAPVWMEQGVPSLLKG